MSQRNFCGTNLRSHAVDHATPQSRAKRTHRFALGDHALDGGIGVLFLNPERHTQTAQIFGKNVRWITGVLLVQVECEQLEGHRRFFAQLHQHIEHAVAVLAPGQANHHLVARFDHVEIGDCLAGQAAQALGEFIGLELLLLRDGRRGDFHRRHFTV